MSLLSERVQVGTNEIETAKKCSPNNMHTSTVNPNLYAQLAIQAAWMFCVLRLFSTSNWYLWQDFSSGMHRRRSKKPSGTEALGRNKETSPLVAFM